jgi:hypothetical protein
LARPQFLKQDSIRLQSLRAAALVLEAAGERSSTSDESLKRKIAVLLGSTQNNKLRRDAWVMSGRAFSRSVEHHLKQLFEKVWCRQSRL